LLTHQVDLLSKILFLPDLTVSVADFGTQKRTASFTSAGDCVLELRFAQFLERCPDVVSYIKNYFAFTAYK